MDQAVRFQSSIIKKYANKWMSFTAFKYSDNNEKIAFIKIERLQNKIIKLKCHLQFNETCIINKMLPTYTNVNLHDDAARNEEFVLEFRLNFIKRQIEEISGKLKKKNISPELTSAKQNLKNTRRRAIRYAALQCYLEQLKQRTGEATKVTQHRKLYGGHILMKETKDFVVNLSGTDIYNELIYIYLQTALPSVCGENAFPPLLFTLYFT